MLSVLSNQGLKQLSSHAVNKSLSACPSGPAWGMFIRRDTRLTRLVAMALCGSVRFTVPRYVRPTELALWHPAQLVVKSG